MLVCFASVMHFMWGSLLLLSGRTIPIAATSVMTQLIPSYGLRAQAYILTALLPLFLLWRPGSVWGLLAVLPQQMLLILSGISALIAITSGHYADGVARPWTFITMDQGIYLVLAVLYAFESLDRFRERNGNDHHNVRSK